MSIADVTAVLTTAMAQNNQSIVLLFAHPEVRPNLTHDGIPITSSAPFTLATHDQLNSRWAFTTVLDYLRSLLPRYTIVYSGKVKNVVTRAMRLTWGEIL
jgi:hypothetical protein